MASTPLEKLSAALAPEMAAVNALILERLQDVGVPLIPQVASHLIAAGGKRIRPLLTLAAGRIAGADPGKTHLLAAAVEFIHSATLLHDDVVDASPTRRGGPSAPATFGNTPAVLVGDVLFARAFEMMVATGSLPALSALATASATIARGEVAQLAAQGDLDAGFAVYTQVIEAKTAALFAAACRAPALLADSGHARALAAYGRALGLAFQVADDVLDYTGGLGKTPGDDLRERKVTAPVLYALQAGDDRAFWARALGDIRALPEAQERLARTGALDAARALARRYADEAAAALPACDLRETLADLARYAAGRA
jgi:octaprenyl-diphosphate synthase